MTTPPVDFPAVSGPEYMPVAFSATSSGVTIDPDSGDAFLTFSTTKADPAHDDESWTAVARITAVGTSGILAEVLFGRSTDFAFPKGSKVYAWIKWEDSPEVIIRRADNHIRIT